MIIILKYIKIQKFSLYLFVETIPKIKSIFDTIT